MELFGTLLTKAIGRGLKPNGDLATELDSLRDYPVKSRKDARAILQAIKSLTPSSLANASERSPISGIANLFKNVDGTEVPAFSLMAGSGIKEFLRLYDSLLEADAEEHGSDLLSILEVCAIYASAPGCERIVQAARRSLAPDSFGWGLIFRTCTGDHPNLRKVLRELSDTIPNGYIAISLLHASNNAALRNTEFQHPFDSIEGIQRLRAWLENSNPEKFAEAYMATVALPFVNGEIRDDLLAYAMEHSDIKTRLEAAWAAAKLGRSVGVQRLSDYCLDVRHCEVASQYLTELHFEDSIPDAAKEPTFQARAKFAHWLAHPNELATPPDEVEVVDSRELHWPRRDAASRFWLLSYRLKDKTGLSPDDTGIGLVGSMTWCFFDKDMSQRPPEDCYAIHCAWEMENENLIEKAEVTDPSEYAHLLRSVPADQYQDCRVVLAAEISPKLKLASHIVLLAEAKKDGALGWIALDNSGPTWYPKDDFCERELASRIMNIHLGYRLLGFSASQDRKRYLAIPKEAIPAYQIIERYEILLDELNSGETNRIQKLLGKDSLLQKHFQDYIRAMIDTTSRNQDELLVSLYDRFLLVADSLPEPMLQEVHETFTVLGANFSSYAQALTKAGNRERVIEIVNRFANYWDHNRGYGELGTAAYEAKQWELAESFFLKLKAGMESYVQCEEMSQLASIWHARGEKKSAMDLILECLAGSLEDIQQSKYNSSRKQYASNYEFHRQMLYKLFPNAQELLAQRQLPFDPLK